MQTKVKTKINKFYYIDEKSGWFFVTSGGGFKKDKVGKTSSRASALDLIKSDSGSDIETIY